MALEVGDAPMTVRMEPGTTDADCSMTEVAAMDLVSRFIALLSLKKCKTSMHNSKATDSC